MPIVIAVLALLTGGAMLLGFNAGNCSLWFDSLLWWNWSDCCAAHDNDYAVGVVKVIADYFLRTCVNASLPGMGEVMWWGVSVVGGLVSTWFYEKARREREQAAAPG